MFLEILAYSINVKICLESDLEGWNRERRRSWICAKWKDLEETLFGKKTCCPSKNHQRINLNKRITCTGNKALKYAQWLAFSRTVFTVILRSVDYYLTLTRNLVLAKLFRKEAWKPEQAAELKNGLAHSQLHYLKVKNLISYFVE